MNAVPPTEPPSTSPGSPVIGQAITRYAAGIVALAAAMLTVVPEYTLAWKVCAAIVGVGAAFGIMSPGVRKAPPTAPPPVNDVQGALDVFNDKTGKQP